MDSARSPFRPGNAPAELMALWILIDGTAGPMRRAMAKVELQALTPFELGQVAGAASVLRELAAEIAREAGADV